MLPVDQLASASRNGSQAVALFGPRFSLASKCGVHLMNSFSSATLLYRGLSLLQLRLTRAVSAGVAVVLVVVSARGATITVQNTNNSGPGSLRRAISDANADDTIDFSVTGTITLTSNELTIDKNLSIKGPGARDLAISRAGPNKFRIINVIGGTTGTIFVSLSGLTISNGDIDANGGGVNMNEGTNVVISDCAIINNSVGFYSGGGIENYKGRLTLNRCTISGNKADAGGGITAISGEVTTMNNCTIVNNAAGSYGGGGVYSQLGQVNIRSCTISGNAGNSDTAFDGGGGINLDAGTVNIDNTIVAGNTTSASGIGPDVNGTFTSGGHNLIRISDGSTGFNGLGDQTGTAGSPVNADLGPLRDNGGPTDTKAPGPNSRAIDQGSSGLAHDQRLRARPYDNPGIGNAPGGDGSDIGAIELQTAAFTILANISTRLRVETGDNVLIGGFIVTGTEPKKIIARAIGPSLNLADKLANPTLELYQGSTFLESNDNWGDSANKQAIIDSTVAPTNNLESAIVRTLPANNSQYTAIVRGVSNGTGIALVEVYDLDRTVDSKLANISTRGLVQTGDNVLIAGTIVVGQASQKVIVRGIGPSLSVPGKLADPTLELHDANGGTLETNDNWVDSTNKQAIIDSTIPPTNNLESAIVRTLSPANYTAIVRGANNTTGIAVVEIYALQ
jgi:hypothetical protein